jgi:hypothetical protein
MSCLHEMHLQTDSVLDKGGLSGVSAYQSMHSSSSKKKRCMASVTFRRAKTAAIHYLNQSGRRSPTSRIEREALVCKTSLSRERAPGSRSFARVFIR